MNRGWCGYACGDGEWRNGEGWDDGGMWGVNWRVVLVCIVFSLIEDAFKGERE